MSDSQERLIAFRERIIAEGGSEIDADRIVSLAKEELRAAFLAGADYGYIYTPEAWEGEAARRWPE